MENSDSYSMVYKNDLITISKNDFELLREECINSPLKRFRICLHQSTEDLVQEMIICFSRGSKVPIHRHNNKSESFYIIEGIIDVRIYNCKGELTEKIRLGDLTTRYPVLYRLNTSFWHDIDVITEFSIVHEIVTGPFYKDIHDTMLLHI